MVLKENKYYWTVSLNHPEPAADDYYIFDQVIVSDKNLIQKIERLRELIISYCVMIEKDKNSASKILDEIHKIIVSIDKIQYTEFIAFWKAFDMSYSVFKKLPNQKFILEGLLQEYCERRRKLYDKLVYSNVTVQALYDSGSSRKKGTSGIEKIKEIMKSIFGDIPKANSINDIKRLNLTYLLPDSGDIDLFLKFLDNFNLKFPYGRGKQNKMPDFLLKCGKHILIIEAKHLKEPGGEQNKSMSELIDFIQQNENDPKIHYVSFIDGVYFNLLISPPVSRRKKENKIQQQRNDIESSLETYKNNFFVNTAGLKTLLNDLSEELKNE
ncbi:MAG: hypothetical protein KatS3mg068_2738 [Candidatus Sericytochromatia bacterium]|nr:MAG: hypothetical protein KatS3mg068_2738 [Candidatus Sericytochromatia bacterium]